MMVTNAGHIVYLLTGSNLNNPPEQLGVAKKIIENKLGRILDASSVYQTAPWGKKDQFSFFNQVVKIQTLLNPVDLMLEILLIEKEMGRKREEPWGPRVIDIDILFFDNRVVNEHNVVIPHPLLHERRFTLVPLHEIAPEMVHPVLKKKISLLLSECRDDGMVEKM